VVGREEVDLRQIIRKLNSFWKCIDIDIISDRPHSLVQAHLSQGISDYVELDSYVPLHITDDFCGVDEHNRIEALLQHKVLVVGSVHFCCDFEVVFNFLVDYLLLEVFRLRLDLPLHNIIEPGKYFIFLYSFASGVGKDLLVQGVESHRWQLIPSDPKDPLPLLELGVVAIHQTH